MAKPLILNAKDMIMHQHKQQNWSRKRFRIWCTWLCSVRLLLTCIDGTSTCCAALHFLRKCTQIVCLQRAKVKQNSTLVPCTRVNCLETVHSTEINAEQRTSTVQIKMFKQHINTILSDSLQSVHMNMDEVNDGQNARTLQIDVIARMLLPCHLMQKSCVRACVCFIHSNNLA